MGALPIQRRGPAIDQSHGARRAASGVEETGRPQMAASDQRRVVPLWALHHRTVVLPGAAGKARSRAGITAKDTFGSREAPQAERGARGGAARAMPGAPVVVVPAPRRQSARASGGKTRAGAMP